jgi:Flp pilus assembly protein TadG
MRSERGYSTVFWAAFIAFVLVPILALASEVGRYARAKGEMYKAADAAALAAAQEVDVPYWRATGVLRLSPAAEHYAWGYAAANASYLVGQGIHPRVQSIDVDQVNHTVHVHLTADITRLFPAVVPSVIAHGEGTAEVRIRR